MKVTEMTQMGLSNTGTEIIRVDSEILADMSPTKVDGTFAGYSYIDTTTDLRYMNVDINKNTIDNGSYSSIVNFSLINFDTSSEANMWNSYINVFDLQ